MPRYFLNIEHLGKIIRDEEGAIFETLAEAREEAIASAREIMSERVAAGKPADSSVFNITDEEGRTVLSVPFEDAIDRD